MLCKECMIKKYLACSFYGVKKGFTVQLLSRLSSTWRYCVEGDGWILFERCLCTTPDSPPTQVHDWNEP